MKYSKKHAVVGAVLGAGAAYLLLRPGPDAHWTWHVTVIFAGASFGVADQILISLFSKMRRKTK